MTPSTPIDPETKEKARRPVDKLALFGLAWVIGCAFYGVWEWMT